MVFGRNPSKWILSQRTRGLLIKLLKVIVDRIREELKEELTNAFLTDINTILAMEQQQKSFFLATSIPKYKKSFANFVAAL